MKSEIEREREASATYLTPSKYPYSNQLHCSFVSSGMLRAHGVGGENQWWGAQVKSSIPVEPIS